MYALISLIAGIVFGLGLILSGMANPAVVQGFLDVFGAWNPALMWVMVGALVVSFIAVTILKKRGQTLLGEPHHLPTNTPLDQKLIIGGLIFGVGWGLVGICPAPALVLVGEGNSDGLIFAAAMIIGLFIPRLFNKK
ncbi:YeeE/YedE family protein [Wohlfahrtiimonas chitiniclastica]|uniref:YeeE/YedE family protein n=1 Tax=Wohlfahrtiimonas chitiniclastica TaxID=400946 RepID=A0AB35C008_9GAMM|nr:YeeE/YedE family protein [Wohlfahrtiimonas chitiniclastica]KZS22777.1 hypothetical protein BMY_0606 [Wohlfahrtiimonas chitiniclastica]MBS7814967.1 YeeE/YedE family protein [Wohlfahrtiimonas chitiniclastica]MBS7815829.1 YeeE/YedE family protein [Wohlfahrtiimonas chitiniclastica]MBS7822176.1 YeeE/YedE family protein [Wohlfahrtiimonas chitiniclastica]MBS7825422.1 YeeE/YedE family protein [Wohlfahrtiimonas chitiniclastica]